MEGLGQADSIVSFEQIRPGLDSLLRQNFEILLVT